MESVDLARSCVVLHLVQLADGGRPGARPIPQAERPVRSRGRCGWMDNRGLMDESELDHRSDPGQADPVPAGQLDIGRMLHARGLARAELTIALLLALGVPLLLFVTAPSGGTHPYVGPRDSTADNILMLAGFAGLFGGLVWMIRIYRRSFGYDEDPPPWRSRRPR